ncbi:MAG: chromate transporter [Rhodocyclaceae bacterium]|nr:chromate transporter [Rhodocyclaceae bacterium]MCP5233317.1 chromate transporter [Zoogloeaceae bacterium]MCB1912261.1 chromate transporter [Rhodocyclaceae bacterium]MCP5238883.1 chromate transporter [Zoogloeaceae bacterium]MCP5254229.1 chromate transporter [Zoogloeaceae bacterium]
MSGAAAGVDLLELFLRFLALSMLSVGGAVSVAPEMHRYLVEQRHWLTDGQFTGSIALAQAAPGPNVLFVPILGYQVAGLAGAVVAMVGILLPSTVLSLWAGRWGGKHRDTPAVRAFTAGLAPISVGLIAATAWVLMLPFFGNPEHRFGALALMAATVVVLLRSKISPIWLIAVGALAGGLGFA